MTPPSIPTNPTKVVQHVVLILMENHGLYQVNQGGAYQRYLAAHFAAATHYYAICHPSVSDYLSITSGTPHQCGTDNYHTYNVTHIGDLVDGARKSWGSYLESMPTACAKKSTTMFNTHHDPFIAYRNVVNNSSRCASHVLNSRLFNSSAVNGTLPNYSLYVPNMNDDCHNTKIPTCDTWLKKFLGPILNATGPAEKAMVAHTVFFVVYDESIANDTSGYSGAHGGRVYLTAISPWSAGLQLTRNASHYDLLSTVEWLMGLGSCGGHDGTAAYPAMKGLFKFP
jgi:acid phosphatase